MKDMAISEESAHDKLDEVLELVRENNQILRTMHRRMLWSQIFTFVYWVIILGIAGWAYYYFQPYVERYIHTYQAIVGNLEALDSQGTDFPSELKSLLDKVK